MTFPRTKRASCLPAASAALSTLSALVLAGCASTYQHQKDENSAALFITGNTRNFVVEPYDDANCKFSEKGNRLATFFGPTKDVASDEKGKLVHIPSGKPFIFANYYIDARYAQNRTCGTTVSFVPEKGKTYTSYFFVDPEVTGCDVAVVDSGGRTNDNVATFKYNEQYCVAGERRNTPNGRATWNNWRFKIIRY